jgi:DNA polymerase
LSERVREALQLRLASNRSSTAKLNTILARRNDDGRIRGIIQYYGANTGRFAGRAVQPHNFPRATPDGDFEAALDVAKQEYNNSLIEILYGDVMTFVSQNLRPCIAAAPHHKLYVADFSAIEARVLAWLAGQRDVLRIFARGEDIYMYDAEKVGSSDRQLGKVQRLALGFGMGTMKFIDTAEKYGIDLEFDLADEIKVGWRTANSHTVAYWRACEDAAIHAIENEGTQVRVGRRANLPSVIYLRIGSFLFCRLPSGRALCYPYCSAKIADSPVGEKLQMHYWGVDSYSGNWVEKRTYGGKLVENITQAVARDFLVEAIENVEAANVVAEYYRVVLHVHDEIITEVRSELDDEIFWSDYLELVKRVPMWAEGFPQDVKGFIGTNYRKD